MSTSEELGEVQPDPIDLVTNLQQSVEELVSVSERLRQVPSDESIEELYSHAFDVKSAAMPILSQRFFCASEKELLIGVSVGALINSGNNLHEKSRSIVGDGVDLWKFTDGVHETLLDSFLTKDMSEFATVTSKSGAELVPEEVFEEVADEVMRIFDVQFSQIVDQYVDIVLSDAPVQSHIERRQQEMDAFIERMAERARRKEQLKQLGCVMVMAFAGTYLANKFQKRG